MSNQMQVARRDVIGGSLAMIRNQVNSLMLKDKQKADRFLAASLVVATDKGLDKCTPDSIAQSLLGIAMLDLNVDKNVGHAYLVPYKGNAQLQLGYKGFIQLMFRAGWACKAFAVYHCDEFSMSFNGWDNQVSFVPNLDLRDEGDRDWVYENLRGIYVVARHSDSKDEYSSFVNKAVIEKLRLWSPSQKSTSDWASADDKKRCADQLPFGIWRDWYAEMACAKAVKKLAKVLPIGDRRLETVIAVDDKVEMGKPVDMVKSIEEGYVIEGESTEQPQETEKPALPELSEEAFNSVVYDQYDEETGELKKNGWKFAVESGKKTNDQVVAAMSTRNTLTEDQISKIKSWSKI